VANNLLITGEPGCGKTTLLLKAIAPYLELEVAGGVYTEEMTLGRERVGFKLKVIGGGMTTLAHNLMYSFSHKLGQYYVSSQAVSFVAVPAILQALQREKVQLVVIDEVARMQLVSDSFLPAVDEALYSAKPVIATVHARAHELTDNIKLRDDVKLVIVTPETREECLAEVLDWLGHHVPL